MEAALQKVCPTEDAPEVKVTTNWAPLLEARPPSAALRRIEDEAARAHYSEHKLLQLERLLNEAECARLNQAAEDVGFGRTNYPPSYRGNLRLIVEDRGLAAMLWERIRPFVPEILPVNGADNDGDDVGVPSVPTVWRACGLNECFRLAWAQQLKNKDIPEGGAKAVCLVAPVNKQDRTRVLHKCVKKFTDALLDLIAPRAQQPIVGRGGSNLRDPIVSRGGCEGELLYLGPDENITPHDINWISQRAAQRQYAMPAAFISSKPEAGINHKEYGVTSEGVTVFLHEGLRAIGIDPAAQPFTVKLTGGPDGDVAGNMLRILHREYAERVRVVGIADGFGCVEDPNGIPMGELLRLVDASLPTSGLDVSRLSAKGKLTLADTREGAAHRNTMHNRVVADAFVPAGGRPSTVNASNWRDFLQPDGTPSARLVVEGANLFFDGAARAALFEHCALPIIKDSSANKCGVICSSMEIVASMVLSEHEFKANKPRYVPQVLTRLRSLARLEAQMLFAERALDDSISLPELSERISVAIMRVGRALDAALDQKPPEQQRALFGFVKDGLPPALFDDESVVARAAERLPWPYQRSCISSGLASRLVYREGLGFVETLPERGLAEYALSYLQGEQRAHELAALVAKAGLSFGPEVEALLLKGGVRAATEAAIAQSKIESGTTAAYPVDLA